MDFSGCVAAYKGKNGLQTMQTKTDHIAKRFVMYNYSIFCIFINYNYRWNTTTVKL